MRPEPEEDLEAGATDSRPLGRPGLVALAVALLFLGGLGLGFLLSPSHGRSASTGDGDVSQAAGEAGEAAGLGAVVRGSAGAAAPASAEQTAAGSSARRTALVEAAERVSPSVVSIVVTRHVRAAPRGFFDLFFQREEVRPGLGSGFVVDDRGHVLTNHHVVRDADSIVVYDSRGRVHAAKLVGTDELTDLAVLELPPGRIPPAPIGTSGDLMVGEPALAIGNPTGFDLQNTEATVTTGVISGVGRDIRSGGQREVLYADMVQTDAAINPGNSGGPLVNADGEVVGVNSAIFSRSGGSEGLGFAIPIDRAMRVADELVRFGRIRRTFVGVDVQSVPSDSLILQAVVRRVAPGSPGAAAGLREGDVLLSAEGTPIRSPLDWEVALLEAGVGGELELRFRRDGRERTTALRIEELPSETAERVEVLRGLQLVSVTPEIAVERRLAVERGALIVDVRDDVAARTGMRPGDVIVAINQREVGDANEAAELFRYYAETQGWVRVWIQRGAANIITTFRIG